jgi:hypothetical protein
MVKYNVKDFLLLAQDNSSSLFSSRPLSIHPLCQSVYITSSVYPPFSPFVYLYLYPSLSILPPLLSVYSSCLSFCLFIIIFLIVYPSLFQSLSIHPFLHHGNIVSLSLIGPMGRVFFCFTRFCIDFLASFSLCT